MSTDSDTSGVRHKTKQHDHTWREDTDDFGFPDTRCDYCGARKPVSDEQWDALFAAWCKRRGIHPLSPSGNYYRRRIKDND